MTREINPNCPRCGDKGMYYVTPLHKWRATGYPVRVPCDCGAVSKIVPYCDSTPRPTQADTLWDDLCTARLRIAELETENATLRKAVQRHIDIAEGYRQIYKGEWYSAEELLNATLEEREPRIGY